MSVLIGTPPALGRLGDDILDPDYPPELVDAELRQMGIDPEELAERRLEFVEWTKRELGQ